VNKSTPLITNDAVVLGILILILALVFVTASIVASAFHPALAPVGVLIAVVGYALGTYGAWICGQLMRLAAPM